MALILILVLAFFAAPVVASDGGEIKCRTFITFKTSNGANAMIALDALSHYGRYPGKSDAELCPKMAECIPVKYPREVEKQLEECW